MKTQEQAVAWLSGNWKKDKYCTPNVKNKAGVVVVVGPGINQDGIYGYQCVDFPTAYSIFLDQPLNGGDTKDAITLWNPQPGWKKITDKNDAQPGDVFVKDYVYQGKNYGHTGGVISKVETVNGVKGFYSIDQNWYNASLYYGSPPKKVFHPLSTIKGYIRPKYDTIDPVMEILISPPVFNRKYYLDNNPDVNTKYKIPNCHEHWLEFGIKEGRPSAPNFHVKEYLANYADLQKNIGKDYKKLTIHFFNHGINENRSGRKITTPGNFDLNKFKTTAKQVTSEAIDKITA